MASLIENIRPYMEVLYFAAGITLAIGLLIARAQLKAFQIDLTIRMERAAKEKSIEACARYFQSFEPLINAFDIAAKPFNLPAVKVKFDSFSHTDLTKEFKDTEKLMTESGVSALDVLNELQLIAAYFSSGVADPRSGFDIIGLSFCYHVEHLYGHIVALRRGHDGDYYQPIVDLYRAWAVLLSRAQLEREREAAKRRLEALPPPQIIVPIGASNS